MWTVIYISPNQKIAERIREKLAGEGFLVKVRPMRMKNGQYEILVPQGELREVQEVLGSIL
ncbi:glutamate decarboxylase [Salinithrix halophila]|uniref:Glutamate decarboxylase n=1 Tax=Salinithrix halophila TaxID=1485204 RepID=A0ABV8JA61_9BACL